MKFLILKTPFGKSYFLKNNFLTLLTITFLSIWIKQTHAQDGYLFSTITISGNNISVPTNESWKIVSINNSPQWGPVSVSIPFFEPGTNYCRYAFSPAQTYLLLNINGMQYTTAYPYTYPNSGSVYQISQNCGGSICTNCPPNQNITFTPNTPNISTIKLPIWVNSGGVIQIAPGVIVSIEKYYH